MFTGTIGAKRVMSMVAQPTFYTETCARCLPKPARRLGETAEIRISSIYALGPLERLIHPETHPEYETTVGREDRTGAT